MGRARKCLPLIASAWLLAACASGSPTFLRPMGPVAERQAALFWQLMILSVIVFVVVWGLLIYIIVRFRHPRPPEDVPEQTYRNYLLEGAWTVIPAGMVFLVLIWTLRTMQAIHMPAPQPQDTQLHVTGKHWWFEFEYPQYGIVTANELHAPVNSNVQIQLVAPDVIHSFWIPQLAGKTDLIPGTVNTMWFRATSTGRFHGQCAEFCGIDHAYMRISSVIDTPEDFQTWVTAQQQPPTQPATPQEQAGYGIVTAGACHECHTLGTFSAAKPIGPNLTHLMSRSVFVGASYPLHEANLRLWLQDNNAMKPGNMMSGVHLSAEEIDPLMAYLLTLK
jgi:cytochrome c oxidase subunit II